MIRVLTLIDMEHPTTMYEVTRVGDSEQWHMSRLDGDLCTASNDEIASEHIHTGSVDEVLRLAKVLMAVPKNVVCSGCQCPVDRCGPKLWIQGRKCCPDCEHVAK